MKHQTLKSVRGMKDGLPKDNHVRQIIAAKIIEQAQLFNYEEIKLPIVEYSEVFKRGIGLNTDVVNKEMYSFQDRNGESLSLRPEGTAGCVRAIIENNLLVSPPLKLWYFGDMFRYERPQKGRQRQFTQFGFELFGIRQIYGEFEIICMIEAIWDALRISDVRLEINSLGSNEDRLQYIDALRTYFDKYKSNFDNSTKETLERNPLRLLDSKNPSLKEMKTTAPEIQQFLSREAVLRLEKLQEILSSNNIKTYLNPHLVRGLDYYSDIVFEWKTAKLGAQDAVCAGGRYDSLIHKMGGKTDAAVGCAIGFDRIIALLSESNFEYRNRAKIYLTAANDELDAEVLKLWKTIKNEVPENIIVLHLSQGSLKSRLKKADKSGAYAALIIGNDELKSGKICVKPLRRHEEQVTCTKDELGTILKKFL